MLRILFAMISAYLIGSIPTSYIAGKAKGIDVRKVGSGNAGATNVLRSVGKWPALITLILDIAKGVVAVTAVVSLFYSADLAIGFTLFRVLTGTSAIAGHIWSIFLKLKGGKGVATSIGVISVLLPKATAIAIGVFLLVLLLTRYVSLGSILLVLTVPIAAAIEQRDIELVILAVTVCIVISYKHRENIKRLIAGTESRLERSANISKC